MSFPSCVRLQVSVSVTFGSPIYRPEKFDALLSKIKMYFKGCQLKIYLATALLLKIIHIISSHSKADFLLGIRCIDTYVCCEYIACCLFFLDFKTRYFLTLSRSCQTSWFWSTVIFFKLRQSKLPWTKHNAIEPLKRSNVREFKTVLDSGFRAVELGLRILIVSVILDSLITSLM